MPLRSPLDYQGQQPYGKAQESIPTSSPKAAPIIITAIILLVLSAGVAAWISIATNSTANRQAANLNHNASQALNTTNSQTNTTRSSTTVTTANNNQTPPVIVTTRDLPTNNDDKNKTGRGETIENKPPNAASVDVSGNWQSFYGSVRLSQSGSAVSGTIVYADGSGTGRISGTLNGRKLTFNWKDATSTYNGAGTVSLSADGRSLKGSIRLNGTTQPLELQR